jgi:glucosylceramidase
MKSRSAWWAPCVFLLWLPGMAMAQEQARLWLTTSDRSHLLSAEQAPLHFSASSSTRPTVEVNDAARYQPIDGFGFAITGGSAQLLMRMDPDKRHALLQELFAPSGEGIHSSYLRVTIGSSDMNARVYSYDDLPEGQTDAAMAHFSLAPDKAEVIPVLQEILAINPHIQILASPWSAPPWMKTNGKVKGGTLKPEFYQAYADYLVKYVQGMKAEGIPIDTITVQNEPLNPKNTPSMVLFAEQEGAFIAGNLGPAFARAGITTRILLYDHNPDVPSYALSILADPDASKYVDGTAFHLYGGDASILATVHNEYPNKNLYLTEQAITASAHEPLGIAASIGFAMVGGTRNWCRNVLLWNLAADPDNGPHTNDGGCTGCQGAVTLDGNQVTRNLAYYTVAHFSKFVPSGSVRIASNELEQLADVAFRTPAGTIVLVLANTSNFPRIVSVRYHGKAFTTTLPAESAGTYVW